MPKNLNWSVNPNEIIVCLVFLFSIILVTNSCFFLCTNEQVAAVSEAFENFQLKIYGVKAQVHATPEKKKRCL